jgi:pimeloyl-ACP methyl ester carboxylesterase
MPSFVHDGHEISYDAYGAGDRPLVLVHGLLMNGHMYDRLGPEMAARGNRVLCIDLLGHGRSDAPADLRAYSMSAFADYVAALLDHEGLDQAVVGGTSLGANVGLEFATRHPERARALFIEMPVLDNALLAVAIVFTPIMVGLRFGTSAFRVLSALANRVPRTQYLVDIGLDWLRRDPDTSLAVLEGLLMGRSCPPRAERETFEMPAFVVGHPADPLHPFSDSDMLVAEMTNARLVDANSILEWRINPGRLNDELGAFLEEVWERGEEEPSVGEPVSPAAAEEEPRGVDSIGPKPTGAPGGEAEDAPSEGGEQRSAEAG